MTRNTITRKKGTKMNINYKHELGMAYLQDIRQFYSPLLCSLDEASFMLNLAPAYGWAPRGERAVIHQPGKRTVTYTLILCVCPVGVLNWSLRSGTVDSEVFSEFLGRLPDGITLMLDNARIHHASHSLRDKGLPTIVEKAEAKNMTLKYIPAYAPHLNPVEFVFNTVRQLLRSREAWTEPILQKAMQDLFKTASFSQAAMTKLFKSVVWGGPHPGTRMST